MSLSTHTVSCPGCHTRYTLDRERLRALLLPLICASCQTIFRVEDGLRVLPIQRVRPLVLVAHESASILEAVRGVLAEAGFDTLGSIDGASALAQVEQHLPQALVIDVGLPGTPAFQIVDEIRRRRVPVVIVLIASVYSRTSYKRRPSSLHGADDYVEQHHLTDMLAGKLHRALAGRPGIDSDLRDELEDPLALAARRARDELILQVAEARMGLGEGEHSMSPDPLLRARRLAWVIVTDIALYNEEALNEGIHRGDVEERLKGDLAEGRSLLAARVPEALSGGRDLIGDALAELVNQRRSATRRTHRTEATQ